MKRKDLNELKTKEVKELVKIMSEKKKALVKVLVEVKVSQESNIKKGRNLRREIAKIATVLREKELIEESAQK